MSIAVGYLKVISEYLPRIKVVILLWLLHHSLPNMLREVEKKAIRAHYKRKMTPIFCES